MRTLSLRLHVIAIIAFTATVLFVCSSAYHVPLESSDFSNSFDDENLITRAKRQVENFDADDYPSATANEEQQEESGFWDRVVKVALKLFSRFIEWLNTS